MSQQLQLAIEAARPLSPVEKLELLEELSRDLQQTYSLMAASASFWTSHSIEKLEAAQPGPSVTDVDLLAVDFWPSDESADDINDFVAEQRHLDRLRQP